MPKNTMMVKMNFHLRSLAPWLGVVVCVGVLLLVGTPFIAVPSVAVAHDEDSEPPIEITPKKLVRARLLFRHYCMDCHGPKMTGDEFDENLLCPDVQGKDRDDYAEAIIDGPDEMPEFQVTFLPNLSDGYLVLSVENSNLLTQHETTFRPDQP